MSAGLAVLGIVAIVGFLIYFAYDNQTNSAVNAVGSIFESFIKKDDGYYIEFLSPKEQFQPQQISTLDLTENAMNSTVQEPIIITDDIPTFSLTNIPPIQGYIILYDPNTGNPIKPFVYDYLLTIDCADLTEFCNLDFTSNRGQTSNAGLDSDGNELGGKFLWDWSHFKTQDAIIPSNVDSVIFNIKIFIDSLVPNTTGIFETFENKYQIRVVP